MRRVFRLIFCHSAHMLSVGFPCHSNNSINSSISASGSNYGLPTNLETDRSIYASCFAAMIWGKHSKILISLSL